MPDPPFFGPFSRAARRCPAIQPNRPPNLSIWLPAWRPHDPAGFYSTVGQPGPNSLQSLSTPPGLCCLFVPSRLLAQTGPNGLQPCSPAAALAPCLPLADCRPNWPSMDCSLFPTRRQTRCLFVLSQLSAKLVPMACSSSPTRLQILTRLPAHCLAPF